MQYIRGENAVISISDKKDTLDNEISAVTGKVVRLTVTGLDKKGQMFREAAPILHLDGRDCSFRSKFQPEMGSWVLIELDLSMEGSKRSTLQGQVKSVQAEGVATSLFQVRVELESSQDVKIVSSPQKAQVSAPGSQSPPVQAAKTESNGTPKGAPPTAVTPSKQGANIEISLPVESKQIAATVPASREPSTPRQPVEASGFDQEAAKSAIASEIKQQLAALKGSFNQELEQIIRQAIEKQISLSYQSAIQTLNNDLAYQLVGRLASNEELRASIENMAKEALEEQIGISRNSAIDAQQNLNLRVAEITQSFEKSIAEAEDRMNVARDSVTAILDRAQALERESAEATLRLQKAVDQLNQAARSTIEKFDGHVTSQLNSWSAQFKKHLDGVSREKAEQFAANLQQQLGPHMQDVNEVLEKLSAGLQLARGTVRIQEEQLAGLSRAAAADFEKEIKAVLLRLAGTV